MKSLTKIQNKKFNNLSIAKQSNAYKSLVELLTSGGVVRTGSSGYSCGWASKSIWTSDVCRLLNDLGVKYIAGNDAPRGGANGEFVKLIDVRLINRISKAKEQEKIKALKVRSKMLTKKLVQFSNLYKANPASADVLKAWKESGAKHPAPVEVLKAKHESGMNWKNFQLSI